MSHFRIGGGERLGWWTVGVVNVWFYKGGGERLRWWTSEVVNVWGGERLGWWTSDFTQGVVSVWGGECLGGESLTICLNIPCQIISIEIRIYKCEHVCSLLIYDVLELRKLKFWSNAWRIAMIVLARILFGSKLGDNVHNQGRSQWGERWWIIRKTIMKHNGLRASHPLQQLVAGGVDDTLSLWVWGVWWGCGWHLLILRRQLQVIVIVVTLIDCIRLRYRQLL